MSVDEFIQVAASCGVRQMHQDPVDTIGDAGEASGEVIRAPRGVGIALLICVSLLVLGGFYLLSVRGDALFLDLAALSGLLFCF